MLALANARPRGSVSPRICCLIMWPVFADLTHAMIKQQTHYGRPQLVDLVLLGTGEGILHGVSSPGSASQTSYPIKAKVRGASACVPSQKHQQLTSRFPSHSWHPSPLTMRHLAADTPTPHKAVTPKRQRQLLLSEELINDDKQL